jgi:hypothetical protein
MFLQPIFIFWWVMVEQGETYSQPDSEQFFQLTLLIFWSQTWICVFILNNCATYCFYLHGSYTSTYIANISLVWRRVGFWKYKMCCQVLSNISEAWNDLGLDLAHWTPVNKEEGDRKNPRTWGTFQSRWIWTGICINLLARELWWWENQTSAKVIAKTCKLTSTHFNPWLFAECMGQLISLAES